MDWIPRERRKRGRPRKTLMERVKGTMATRNLETDQGETERNGLWFPEDVDSC